MPAPRVFTDPVAREILCWRWPLAIPEGAEDSTRRWLPLETPRSWLLTRDQFGLPGFDDELELNAETLARAFKCDLARAEAYRCQILWRPTPYWSETARWRLLRQLWLSICARLGFFALTAAAAPRLAVTIVEPPIDITDLPEQPNAPSALAAA